MKHNNILYKETSNIIERLIVIQEETEIFHSEYHTSCVVNYKDARDVLKGFLKEIDNEIKNHNIGFYHSDEVLFFVNMKIEQTKMVVLEALYAVEEMFEEEDEDFDEE